MTRKFEVPPQRPFFGKYWPEGVPHQLDFDYTLTLPKLLKQTANRSPQDPVMWFLDGWMNYAEFANKVARFASKLYELGIRKGDVIALHLPNSPQYVIAYYAVLSIGGIVTGINPTYKPLEILHQLQITNAKTIVVLDALFTNFIIPILDRWEFTHIIYTNLLDLATSFSKLKKWLAFTLKKVPKTKITHPRTISFSLCLKAPISAPEVRIDAEKDTAVLMMTGGTTGVPKAAILTHQNIVANAKQCEITLCNQEIPHRSKKLGAGTGMFGVLPLFHSFAMTTVMNLAITVGGWMMLFPKPPPTEDLLQTFDKLPDINGYIYAAAEILFQRISEVPEKILSKYDLQGKLTLCVSGAGPLHEYVRIPYEKKTGAKIREGYGLAEASPVVSANNFFGELNPGSIGTPFPGTDWQIFPTENFDAGPILEFGEDHTGEICICGPQVMQGYLNEEAQTHATIREWDGRLWLLTGDIGYMDEHGCITIRDRKKQLIKIAGHSVFPKEVESLLGNHPQVLEVAVAGLPDKKTGEIIKAWVALKPNTENPVSSQDLLEWAQDNITYWKCPKFIEIVEEIPKSAIGKVMRRTLQEADPLFHQKMQ